MIFFDYEVFTHDWLVVLKNPETRTTTKIHNDDKALRKFYEENKNDIWVSYNGRNYDQFIQKAILCGFNPKVMNDWIIVKGKSGWQFNSLMRNFPLLNYDVMTTMHSLKQLEGFMGNNIHETSVDFNINRPLTSNEIKLEFEYCESDVDNLIEVFIERINDFNSAMDLIKTFKLPIDCISKTKAQMSAIIIGCEKVHGRNDEWDISIVPTLKLKKYDYVRQWFLNNKGDYSKNLEIMVAGVPHVFGWGGIHGAKEKYHSKGLILHVDVTSYYPSLMIEYNLLTRNCKNPAKFKEIYDKRVQLKKEGKKKEQAPYKIVLNATYGICKDKYSLAYDPLQANNVCINGQLLLLDLIEKLEVVPGFELIQSNTDGLIIKIPDSDKCFDMVDDICYEWETRTKMGLGIDYIKEIYQKDVNNYVFIDDADELERKGAYVKESNRLDNDLQILNTALVNYMAYGIPVETTINECDDLIQFQKIVRVSSKYELGAIGYERNTGSLKVCVNTNKCNCKYKQPSRAKCFKAMEYTKCYKKPKILTDRTFRVFASKDSNDGYIGKMKTKDSTLEKFANTPDNMFIANGNINGVKCTEFSKLDKQYYIELAKKRLSDYGVI